MILSCFCCDKSSAGQLPRYQLPPYERLGPLHNFIYFCKVYPHVSSEVSLLKECHHPNVIRHLLCMIRAVILALSTASNHPNQSNQSTRIPESQQVHAVYKPPALQKGIWPWAIEIRRLYEVLSLERALYLVFEYVDMAGNLYTARFYMAACSRIPIVLGPPEDLRIFLKRTIAER